MTHYLLPLPPKSPTFSSTGTCSLTQTTCQQNSLALSLAPIIILFIQKHVRVHQKHIKLVSFQLHGTVTPENRGQLELPVGVPADRERLRKLVLEGGQTEDSGLSHPHIRIFADIRQIHNPLPQHDHLRMQGCEQVVR